MGGNCIVLHLEIFGLFGRKSFLTGSVLKGLMQIKWRKNPHEILLRKPFKQGHCHL
jgi:hypothetical protein